MTKRLHTACKIFFNDPYVIKVFYTPFADIDLSILLKKLVRRVYKTTKGTWGHTAIIHDTIYNGDDISVDTGAYFCFKEEADALQFRLMLDCPSSRVFIWPEKVSFTIHEYVEDADILESE